MAEALSRPMPVLLRCIALGVAAGMRTSAPIAALVWKSPGAPVTKSTASLLWLGELLVDKLPFTPERRSIPGLVARLASGAIAGALRGRRDGVPRVGALVGAAGAALGTFGSAYARERLVKHFPRLGVALAEDAVATRLARWAA
ncbi:MAG: hypothetical protein JNK04_03965 [Myxococcales bacterium]|nr:hypothetical protein [Myxococcales bacterium]